MDGASGDELEAGSDCPPKETRYHRHTPRNLVHAYLQIDLVHPELGLLSTMNNNNNIYVVFVSSAYQKKAMHTLLASKLTQLHIPSAATADPSQDLISPTCWPRRRAVSDFRLLAPRMNPHHKGKNKNTHTCTHIYGVVISQDWKTQLKLHPQDTRYRIESVLSSFLVLLLCVTKVVKSAFDKALVGHEDIDDVVGPEEPTERDHGVDLQQPLLIKIDSSDSHQK
ncbi:hypothetical protein OROMI_003675 [Orobanche minor]